MKKTILMAILVFSPLFADSIELKKPKTDFNSSFAIVIDQKTSLKVMDNLETYMEGLKRDSLNPYLLITKEAKPEEIKKRLKELYQDKNLEGAVFIGDIPVPMLRNAQHLTSAFKMDQERFSIQESSIPSDRYYEDFDLRFDFLSQDTSDQLLYYYSLRHDSPQKINKEIYSGRIFPPVRDSSKYEMISTYLKKAGEYKLAPAELNRALFTLGHGYYSESLTSFEGESLTLKEQFPRFFQFDGFHKYYIHTMSVRLKSIIKRELQNPDHDFAVFHAHGGPELQYLLGDPPVPTFPSKISALRYSLRNKLRKAKRKKKSVDSVKYSYMEKMGVDSTWFEGAFVDSVIKRDSLKERKIDMHIEDIREIIPQPYLIIFDECFNGRFIESPYIAGEYVFNPKGRVICGIANSVNVLQDIWPNENLEMLSYGSFIGEWHKKRPYLESHIMGDPTFHYKNTTGIDLNKEIENHVEKNEFPRDIRQRSLFIESQPMDSNEDLEKLYNLYFTEPAMTVRTQIVKKLCASRSQWTDSILVHSINDPYELIRRKTVTIMADRGLDMYIRPLLITRLNEHSARTNFNSNRALEHFSPEKIKTEFDLLMKEEQPYLPEKSEAEKRLGRLFETDNYYTRSIKKMNDPSLTMKKRINSVRTFRNQNIHYLIPEFIKTLSSPETPTPLKIAILELFGWFSYSYQKDNMIEACQALRDTDEVEKKVKEEAMKTIRRLQEGANHAFTP